MALPARQPRRCIDKGKLNRAGRNRASPALYPHSYGKAFLGDFRLQWVAGYHPDHKIASPGAFWRSNGHFGGECHCGKSLK